MIIPALDLINGQVVRLTQGDYAQQQQYSDDPLALLQDYVAQGATYLHLVDLDGAKEATQRQHKLINQLISELNVPVQIGGGIRHADDIQALLQAGVQRVVIGSVAVSQPKLVCQWLRQFGAQHLVLAFDIRIDDKQQKWLATHGWQHTSDKTLEDAINYFLPYGLKHILCTDIAHDGMLDGPNVALYHQLKQHYPQLIIQASGGVSRLQDLSHLQQSGVDAVIIGRALLEGKFTVQEALACWPNA